MFIHSRRERERVREREREWVNIRDGGDGGRLFYSCVKCRSKMKWKERTNGRTRKSEEARKMRLNDCIGRSIFNRGEGERENGGRMRAYYCIEGEKERRRRWRRRRFSVSLSLSSCQCTALAYCWCFLWPCSSQVYCSAVSHASRLKSSSWGMLPTREGESETVVSEEEGKTGRKKERQECASHRQLARSFSIQSVHLQAVFPALLVNQSPLHLFPHQSNLLSCLAFLVSVVSFFFSPLFLHTRLFLREKLKTTQHARTYNYFTVVYLC